MTKLSCNGGKDIDCCPFRKIVIPSVMGDDSEGSECAPANGAYRNALVEYEANGAMYIYASDGIFTKLALVAGEEGAATTQYVDNAVSSTLASSKQYTDAQDAITLQAAKDYTDAHSGEGGVSQQYVDEHDATVLSDAKNYADSQDTATLSLAEDYTDTEAASAAAGALADAKLYADGKDSDLLSTVNDNIAAAITAADVPVFTLSSVDLGEGQPLAANHFYGVYEENA